MKRAEQKASVTLTVKDWEDLAMFVRGDLDCMDESEIKEQMRRIVKTILNRIARYQP